MTSLCCAPAKALLAAAACYFTLVSSAAIDRESLTQRADVPAGFYALPFYPAPHGGWASEWAASYAKAEALVAKMTLAEKTNITSGTGIFMGRCVGMTGSALQAGFPQLCLQDGPLGLRSTDHNTAFPAGITTGATFDKNLMYQRGVALGKEFRGKGVNIHLGPSVGPLGRKPRGGRNWEGFGSDPVLQAVGGAETIKGIQEQGVIATIKHLIGNEQEMYRMYNPLQPAYSANIDDRTLHEHYLWPFAEGIRAGVGSVMAAYNAVNGSACSQNAYLINGILKDELGFQGFIMTDWLAQISGVGSALAGLDMNMPGDGAIPLTETSYWMYDLTRAVLNGSVPVDRLNDMVTRIVATWYQFGQDQNYPKPNFHTYSSDAEGALYPGALFSPTGVINEFVNVQDDHYKVAREVAQDGITLLKNVNNTLPLKTTATLKVFGDDARANPDGINSCSDKGCTKGTVGMGWGSGSANYPYFDAPIDALKSRASNVTYFSSNSFPSNSNPSSSDVAIVFIYSNSGENYITVESNHGDRDYAGLYTWYGGDELVQKAAAAYSTVIVVIHTVGPMILEKFIDLPSVKAVVLAHLPGQEAGVSLTNVLFGDVSPNGHLPYTIAKAENDYGDSVGLVGSAFGQVQDTYTEGLYIDYRYFHKNKIAPRYPFGHGLSYTTFSYSAKISSVKTLTATPPVPGSKGSTPVYANTIPPASEAYYPDGFSDVWRYLYSYLSKSDADAAAAKAGTAYPYPTGYSATQKTSFPAAGGGQGGNPALWDVIYTVSVTVTNTGSVAGKAVVQAYVQYPSTFGYDTPIIQLRDFGKTDTLAPGASQALTISLTRKDLSVWDVVSQNWVASASGEYTVWVGDSSANLTLGCSSTKLTCQSGRTSPV